MPEVTLHYIEDGNHPVMLMTEEERLRLLARIEDVEKQSRSYDDEGLPEEAVSLRCQVELLRQELAINDDLAAHPDAKAVTFTFDEPTLGDLEAVRAALPDVGKAYRTAYERLMPKPIKEDEEAIHFKFVPQLTSACYQAIDYNPSEERRFFLMRRRLRSSGF